MVYGNRRTGHRPQVGLVLGLCAGMVACASSQPVQAANSDFNGSWSAKWCDPEFPGAQCGNVGPHLFQRGERICGQHFAAAPRLAMGQHHRWERMLSEEVSEGAVARVRALKELPCRWPDEMPSD